MPRSGSQPSSGDGVVVPTLAELVALSQRVAAWPPSRRARGGSAAVAYSPLRGRGMEYAESRAYLPGDDARHIDWRLSARTGKAHSKLFHPERERTTLLVCDGSEALRFGTRVRLKSVQAARAAALAAWAAARSGERIGAVLPGGVLKPGNGQRGVLRVLRAVVDAYAAPATGPDLGALLARSARLAHGGSRVIVVADPGSVAALGSATLPGLARHNDVVVVMLADPFELAPPRRALPLRWGGGRELVDLSDATVRDAWQERFALRLQHECQRLLRQRIATVVLPTPDEGDGLLQALLQGVPSAA